MPQSLASLGGYTFPYNPYSNMDWQPRSITLTQTLGGGYWTDYGTVPQDRTFTLTWAIIDRAFYQELYSLSTASSVQYTYVDPYGLSSTVVVKDLKNSSYLAGGDDAYEGAVMVLGIVSIP